MGTATITWQVNNANYQTNYTHTRIRVINGVTGDIAAQQFVPFPGTSATFTSLAAGTYSADICLSDSTGAQFDAGGVIGAGIFSITQQFSLPKPSSAVVVVS